MNDSQDSVFRLKLELPQLYLPGPVLCSPLHPTPSFFTGHLPRNLAPGVKQYPTMHKPWGKILRKPKPSPVTGAPVLLQLYQLDRRFSRLSATQRERYQNKTKKS